MSFSSTPLFLEPSIIGSSLEIERTSLLERVLNPSNENASALKKRYNEIIEKQVVLRRGRLPDPIKILPSEIYIRLIQEIIDRPDGRSVDQLLILTLVDKRWRSAALATPEFWSEVYIGAGLVDADLLAKVQTCLYLSQNFPIRLVIEHPTRDWDHVLPKLRPHIHRIREIVLGPVTTRDAAELDPLNPSIDSILLSLGHLPMLRAISRHGTSLPADECLETLFTRTPSVTSINDIALPAPIMNHQNLDGLARLYSKSPFHELAPRLARLSSLRSLILGSTEDLGGPLVTHVPTFDVASHNPFTQLRYLTFRQGQGEDYFHLLRLSINLTELVTFADWELLPRLMLIISDLSQLATLELLLQCHDRPVKSTVQSADINLLLNLKNLVIKEQEEATKAKAEDYQRLFALFQECAPSLENISLILDVPYCINLDFINTFSNLRELRLQLECSKPGFEAFRLQSASLQTLRLHLMPNLLRHVCSTLSCSRLASLNIYALDDDLERSPIVLEAERCKGISFIYWADDWMSWSVKSLNSLRLVEFGEYADTVATDFCVHMILRPYDCPALEEVEFNTFPEWDCLFLMLERRNFLLNSPVSPIGLIALPSLIHPCLRIPLVALLRGCFTERPSNHDLSLAGISQTYFDKAILGCHFCHLTMQPCLSSLSRRYRRNIQERKANPVLDSIHPEPALPTETSAWLAKRQERYKSWAENEESWTFLKRTSSCAGHVSGYRYLTTGYSLDGVTGDELHSLRLYKRTTI